ncbi:MAG: phosphoadenylyl-sulfate reductase [Planctomycetota bacterium]
MKLPVIDHVSPPVVRSPVDAGSHPGEVLAWALARFGHCAIAATTGFGMEGCALIDMLAERGVRTRVIYIDTHFLFRETLELRDRLIRRYPTITFVNAGTMISPERQAAEHGTELWKRDADLCCRIRKVEPLRRALRGVDAWITGLRREQSPSRASTELVQWDWQYQLVKISPLAYWTRAQVWEYVQRHDVPFNPLHEQGYPSIGCTHCTARVPGSTPGSYSREGRWPGQDKTECGLHMRPEGSSDTSGSNEESAG